MTDSTIENARPRDKVVTEKSAVPSTPPGGEKI